MRAEKINEIENFHLIYGPVFSDRYRSIFKYHSGSIFVIEVGFIDVVPGMSITMNKHVTFLLNPR